MKTAVQRFLNPKNRNILIVTMFLTIVFAVLIASLSFGEDTRIKLESTMVDQILAQHGYTNTNIADELKTKIENSVTETVDAMLVVAALPELKTTNCASRINAEDIKKQGEFGVLDTNGKVTCTNTSIGFDYDTLAKLNETYKDQKDNANKYSTYFQEKTTGEYITTIHIPLYSDNRQYTGTLFGVVHHENLINKYLEETRISRNRNVLIVDNQGNVAFSLNPNTTGKNIFESPIEYLPIDLNRFEALLEKRSTKTFHTASGFQNTIYEPINMSAIENWLLIVASPINIIGGYISPFIVELQYKIAAIIGVLTVFIGTLIMAILKWNRNLIQRIDNQTQELASTQSELLKMLDYVENEKEKVLAEKEKMNAILQSIGEGVFAFDKEYRIIMFNRMAEKLTGVPAPEALGKTYQEVIKFEYEKEKQNILQESNEGSDFKVRTDKTVLLKRDGSKISISDSSAPLINQNNEVLGWVVAFRDITKESQIDKMKTEFISLASHQLRTPLSAIKWYGEMLLNGDAGNLSPDMSDFVQKIYYSNERMISLVNDLLNITRIESGRIIVDPEPVDLKELIQGVVDEIANKIKEKNQKLVISVHENLGKVNLDPKLIRHVYLNLITNASKYSNDGGEISIFVSRKGDEIISQISDNGRGIPKSEQHRVFQKFYRGTNIVKMDVEGTGLGLYLIKTIVESSKGRIWFESEEGKGTTFWFSLPSKGLEPKEGEVTISS